jgi:predicted ester cyclase
MKKLTFLSLLLTLVTWSVSASNYPTPSDIVKAYFTHLDNGDFAELEKLLAEDLLASAPFLPQPAPKQAWLGVGKGFKAAFPNMKHEVLAIVETGFTVAVRGVFKGKNDGSMMGNPPTGNRVSVPFNTMLELDKSWKIKAVYVQFDQKAFEMQLLAGLPNPMVQTELNIRAMLEAADRGDAEKFFTYWSAGKTENYFAGAQTSDDDMKKRIVAFKAAFPDIKRNLEEVIVSGNTVTVRGWVTGTNKGQFMGQAPTNNSIKVSWLGLYHLDVNGKVEKGWVEFDTAALQNQVKNGIVTSGK